jgi:hypothetical protein
VKKVFKDINLEDTYYLKMEENRKFILRKRIEVRSQIIVEEK